MTSMPPAVMASYLSEDMESSQSMRRMPSHSKMSGIISWKRASPAGRQGKAGAGGRGWDGSQPGAGNPVALCHAGWHTHCGWRSRYSRMPAMASVTLK